MHLIRCKSNVIFFGNVNKTGGGFNVVLDTDLDCSGGNPSKNDSTKNISDLCLDFDLVDIWRIRNPETKRFTWRQKRPLIQRRLDYLQVTLVRRH